MVCPSGDRFCDDWGDRWGWLIYSGGDFWVSCDYGPLGIKRIGRLFGIDDSQIKIVVLANGVQHGSQIKMLIADVDTNDAIFP